MSRRRASVQREICPDPVYGDVVLSKFINYVMEKGKKSPARRMVFKAFDEIASRSQKSPLEVFHRALEHVKPAVEVRSRRVAGATYQIPVAVRESRRLALAMRWIIEFAKKRGERGFAAQLAAELLDASDEEGGRGRGGSVKKREDTHKMAEANKAFSHYRW